MTALVKHTRNIVAIDSGVDYGFATGKPVTSEQWTNLCNLTNYLNGRGGQLVTANAEAGGGISPGAGEVFSYFVYPRFQGRAWLWLISFSGASEDAFGSIAFSSQDGGPVPVASWSTTGTSGGVLTYFQNVTQTDTPVEAVLAIASDAASSDTVFVNQIACYEMPRMVLEPDPTTDVGADPALCKAGSIIASGTDGSDLDLSVSGPVDGLEHAKINARRNGLFHSVIGVSDYPETITATSYTPIYRLNPEILGRMLDNNDGNGESQGRPTAWNFYGYMSGGTGYVRATTTNGSDNEIKITTTDTAWGCGWSLFSVDAEDLEVSDGRRVGTTEEITFEAKVEGSATLYLRGISAGEPAYRTLPFDAGDFTNASARNIAGYSTSIVGAVTGPFAAGTLATRYINIPCAQFETARTGVITENQDLDDDDWTPVDASVSADDIDDPLGNATADKLVEDAGDSTHYIEQAFTPDGSSVYAASIFAKADERDEFLMKLTTAGFPGGGPGIEAYFDLGDGTVGTTASTDSAGIEDMGDGWYRCWMTATSDAALSSNFRILMCDTGEDKSYQGDGTSGMHFWGAQCEIGVWPSSYIHTEASAVTRAKDQFVWPAANVPSWIKDEKHAFIWIPEAASTDTRDNQYIFDYRDASNSYRVFAYWSTDDRIYVRKAAPGWTILVKTAPLTVARGSHNLIILDPAAGTIELPFTTSGDKVTDTSWDGFISAISTLTWGGNYSFSATAGTNAIVSQPFKID